MVANTKELGMLTNLVQKSYQTSSRGNVPVGEKETLSHLDGSKDASGGGETSAAQKCAGETQDLLRRLKRGCILQYGQQDDDDDEDGGNRPQQTGTIFERFQRHV
jgi:hypothetical protein